MKESYKNDCPYYLEDFLINLSVIKNRGDLTSSEYYLDIRTFLRYLKVKNKMVPAETKFNDITISDVPIEMIENFTEKDAYLYMVWLKDERQNGASARARKTTSLKQFYDYLANKAQLIPKDNMASLEVPHVKRALPKYLSLDEVQKLLSSIRTKNTERDYCIITLFLNCGMRLSELCGININDISFENKTLRLLGKGKKERIITLNNNCLDAIEKYLPYRKNYEMAQNEKALFLSSRKNRLSRRRVQKIIEECIMAAGLKNTGVTTHKLRHTAATLMYNNNGGDILAVKEILGHESTATTEIYTHLGSEKMKNTMDVMEDLLKKKD
ncbi:tyrosine-type recombinase/integrase [Ruminococcus albus]|uniref:tyrosine-type recombinase/integrase n=1 Tax=Ruminococcus albus TaxID=1264 RepID=UPI000465AEAF|nr:tyrosine-type recombinase/integrase [Ruminococcus albus]